MMYAPGQGYPGMYSPNFSVTADAFAGKTYGTVNLAERIFGATNVAAHVSGTGDILGHITGTVDVS